MYGTVILPVPVPYRYDTVPYGIILYSTVFYSTVPVPVLSNTVTRNSSMVPVLYGTVRYGTTGLDRTAKFVYKVGNNHAQDYYYCKSRNPGTPQTGSYLGYRGTGIVRINI